VEQNGKYTPQSLRVAIFIQAFLIIAVFAYFSILQSIPPNVIISMDGNYRDTITVILSVFGMITFVTGYFSPRLLRPRRSAVRFNLPDTQICFFIQLVQAGSFEAIAVYGLIMGILNISLGIVLVFFAISIIGLFLTFPTRAKWDKMMTKFKPPSGSQIE